MKFLMELLLSNFANSPVNEKILYNDLILWYSEKG